MTKPLKVAVVGATGVVGREMLRVLEERDFPVGELLPVASPRSAGKKLPFGGGEVEVVAIAPEVFEGVDVALFSAGGGTSREWAPIVASKGAIVIDNSSAWRRDPDCPLVVPEVNAAAARAAKKGIIANPNCSTIQMVVALKPLHDAAKLRRVVVSTYQAISGKGHEAVEAFERQRAQLAGGAPLDEADRRLLEGQLAGNVLMHWSRDVEAGYQEEELKMVFETKKIFGDESIRVSPTTVRVPVVTGHAESVTVECEKPLRAADVRAMLQQQPGVVVVDDFAKGLYPTPLDAVGKDPVFVGRIRDDVGNPGGIQMWIVADNLRKGAATNAVQIAESLFC